MFMIACANIGATGTMRMFRASRTAAVGSIESVMTRLFIADFGDPPHRRTRQHAV
jgi:hypothetical protein